MALAASNLGQRIAKGLDVPLKHTHLFNPKISPPRQAWVENFIDSPRKLLGIIELHPKVFGVFPRLDYVSSIVQWQKTYRDINYVCMPTRNELPGGTRRPWPQKGMGRARHASIRSPIFIRGGWARGPRGPTTSFTIKPHFNLVNALRSMLTIKLAQDDIKIVDSIETSIANADELEKKFEERQWGPSALIVDKTDEFPQALVSATQSLGHVNLMSATGLNTLSMCKHESLIITLDALREIEDKLLFQLVRVDLDNTHVKYRDED